MALLAPKIFAPLSVNKPAPDFASVVVLEFASAPERVTPPCVVFTRKVRVLPEFVPLLISIAAVSVRLLCPPNPRVLVNAIEPEAIGLTTTRSAPYASKNRISPDVPGFKLMAPVPNGPLRIVGASAEPVYEVSAAICTRA